MNDIDFQSSPNGFPLEADSTLGYMYDSLKDAIEGLAKLADDDVIVSGVDITGNSASSGWVVVNGELLFFEGGTISTNCIVEETVIAKNNQGGTPVDRYFTRKVIFGTGTGQFAFSSLRRIRTVFDLMGDAMRVATLGEFDPLKWVVVEGGKWDSITKTVSAGTAYFGSQFIPFPAQIGVTATSPQYLQTDGTWSLTNTTNSLPFAPYTSRRIDAIVRRNSYPLGAIMFVATTQFDSEMADQFDVTGLGSGDWEGWAKANGSNGTISTANHTGTTTIQRI